MPPTVPWERPPFSATPPSPAAYPAAAAVGLSGPPTTSPASASFEPLPLGSNGGRWRVAAGALGGMAFSAVLVAGGFGLAQIVDDDPMPVPEVTEDAGSTELAMTDNEVAAPTIVPAPLTDADAVEPIAAVAQAISPSVVLIETGVGQGSGIVWDAVNGYIVTNDHVAGDATTVTVRFDNGVEVVGTVIGGDQTAIEVTEESVGGAVVGSVLITPLIWDNANNTLVVQVNHGVSNPAVGANTHLPALQSVEYLKYSYDSADIFYKAEGATATTMAGFEGAYVAGGADSLYGLLGHQADGTAGVAFSAGDIQHIDYEVLPGNVSVFNLGS